MVKSIIENDKLYGVFDASVWAKQFVDQYPNGTDQDTMLGWFANAIMTGFDRGFIDGARFEREAHESDTLS